MGCNFCDSCSDCAIGRGIGCDSYGESRRRRSKSYDYAFYDEEDEEDEEDSLDEFIDFAYDEGDLEDLDRVPKGQIHWTEARKHLGEKVTVFGKLDSIRHNKPHDDAMRWQLGPEVDPTSEALHLTMGESSYLDIFVTLVVWPQNRSLFGNLAGLLGREVSVQGEPYRLDGRIYIEISSPSQLEVHDVL